MNFRMLLAFLLGWLVGNAPITLHADEGDDSNPYSIIVTRNIFHLNPLPPPPEPEKPKVELPLVRITGFVHVAGQTHVLFVTQSKDKKETGYYSLAQGERSMDHHLELVRILSGESGVDILNDGVAATLTVKENSNGDSPLAIAAPAASGAPPAPGPGPNPGAMPGRPMFKRPMQDGQGGPGGPPSFNGFAMPMRARRNLNQPGQ